MYLLLAVIRDVTGLRRVIDDQAGTFPKYFERNQQIGAGSDKVDHQRKQRHGAGRAPRAQSNFSCADSSAAPAARQTASTAALSPQCAGPPG